MLHFSFDMASKVRGTNIGVEELGGMIWLINKYLPNMLLAGGRVSKGYPNQDRQLRWEKVRKYLAKVFGSERTTSQIKHRWADLISREADLLDHLGLDIIGNLGMYIFISFFCMMCWSNFSTVN